MTGLDPESLVIKNSRLTCLGHVECKDVNHCMTTEVDGTRQRCCPRLT